MKIPLNNSMAAIALSTTDENKDNASTSSSSSIELQQEMLLERLRTKAQSFRPLADSAKALRMCILNKQHLMDTTDKSNLSSCLDTLQQHIPVTSLDAMLERLQATAKQLGLKFTSSAKYEVYISCDMFYVEVLLNRDGSTQDVRVEFAGESSSENVEPGQSCPELMDCLSRCDFKEFTAHLEGFLSMYTLDTDDKKAKLRTQYALKALETDLSILFELAQDTISDTYKLVLKSPVGLLVPRRGGHSMRLIYFISPYELLDTNEGTVLSLNSSTVNTKEFGQHVQLRIEATTEVHKVQLTALMQITKGADGKKLPSFSGLNSTNSITIPSVFALKLPTPLPLSLTLARKIAEITGIKLKDITGAEVPDVTQGYPPNTTYRQLVELIIHQASDKKISNNDRGLYVTLPDQQHCYFVSTQGCDFPGMYVGSIPFTHPTHITSVLMILRQQAAFNALIGSCVRPNSKQDVDTSYMFEVTSLSHEYISVTFEHPVEESTATAEIDLTDLCNIKCRLHTLSPHDHNTTFCSDEYATKVLQRCLSIPITMRAVMRKVTKEDRKMSLSLGDNMVLSANSNSDLKQNSNKFFLSEYDRKNQNRPGNNNQIVNNSGVNINKSASNGLHAAINSLSSSEINSQQLLLQQQQQQQQQSASFFSNSTPAPPPYIQVKSEPGIENNKVQQLNKQSFLDDVKAVKVRKRKLGSHHYGNDDIIEIGGDDPSKDPLDISDVKPFADHENRKKFADHDNRKKFSSHGLSSMKSVNENTKFKREYKMEKLHNFLAKRRASNNLESSKNSPTNTSDLAALREQVYGAGSAATYAQLMVPANPSPPSSVKNSESNSKESSSSNSSKDSNNSSKKSSSSYSSSKKSKSESSSSSSSSSQDPSRKSPIVLDLTDAGESGSSGSKKSTSSKSGSSSGQSSSSSTSSLLKRPGIEIFPIPGSSNAINIPSSITVTPVLKSTSSISSSSTSSHSYSSDDKYKDKKDRKDKKESSSSSSSDRKDKKRRREDSPSGNSSKSSKVQIISGSKHSSSSSSSSSSDKYAKVDKSSSSSSSSSSKPNTPPYQSPSNKKSVPTSPKTIHKLSSYNSPTHKTSSSSSSSSKSNYSSPSSQSSYYSSSSSPKSSPKHPISGKPSLNALKSTSSSSSSGGFSKPSLSPKLSSSSSNSSKSSSGSSSSSSSYSSSSSKDKESSRSSNSSPSRSSSSSSSSSKSKSSSSSGYISGSSSSTSSSSSSDKASKSESSSGSSSSSSTKSSSSSSSSGGSSSSSSNNNSNTSGSTDSSHTAQSNSSTGSFFQAGNIQIASALQDKSSLIDRAKASPPKNRKGSCLSDIVDKLRAGVSGGIESILQQHSLENSDKKEVTKMGGINDPKKDPDKKTDYTIKPLDGLKLSINKAKMKELKEAAAKSVNSSVSPTPKSLKSGLKPGVSSGPASKKVSMSSLPPIPKLASIASASSSVSISPLSGGSSGSNNINSSYSSNSSSTTRDHQKDVSTSSNSNKSSNKDRISSSSGSNTNSSSSKSSSSSTSTNSSSNSSSSSRSSDSRDKHSKVSVNSSGQNFSSFNKSHSDGLTKDSSTKSKSESATTNNVVKSNSVSVSSSKFSSSIESSNSSRDSVKTSQQHSTTSTTNVSNKTTNKSLPSVSQCLPPLPPPPLSINSGVGGGGSNYPHPLSPSVSIKIVKSPAPVTSPMSMISPLTSQLSPCLIDDDLMDEALMGPRK